MKALIFNNVVMQVSEATFEVHKDWKWVECSNEVEPGYIFVDGSFTPPAPIQPRTYSEMRAKNYPSIGDQLDALFKAGVFPEEMAAQIQAVKDKYPKSE